MQRSKQAAPVAGVLAAAGMAAAGAALLAEAAVAVLQLERLVVIPVAVADWPAAVAEALRTACMSNVGQHPEQLLASQDVRVRIAMQIRLTSWHELQPPATAPAPRARCD